jgi:hypothetical protein
MDGTSPLLDCRLAGVPATSDRWVQSVHQSKYWNGSEKLRSHSRYSNSEAAAQFFHQCPWDQVEELVIFVLLFARGVALSLRPLEDCPRLFPTDQQSH